MGSDEGAMMRGREQGRDGARAWSRGGAVTWEAVTRARLARGRARAALVVDARRESQANFENILRRIRKRMRNLITKTL